MEVLTKDEILFLIETLNRMHGGKKTQHYTGQRASDDASVASEIERKLIKDLHV